MDSVWDDMGGGERRQVGALLLNHIGPVVSKTQCDKIQSLIQVGIDEGAKVVAGGLGKPEGLNKGYFVKPTAFADVNNQMQIARTEIFGPVLSIIPFETEEEAIEIANDTPYGFDQRDDEECSVIFLPTPDNRVCGKRRNRHRLNASFLFPIQIQI